MSEGMTRRELIKASAIAGTVAWTAPIILRGTAGAVVNTVCFAVKISSCANSTGNPGPGTVAQCDFTGAQLTVNFGTCINLECSTYAPVNGFFFSVRGPVATNLTRIALKWSGNAPATC